MEISRLLLEYGILFFQRGPCPRDRQHPDWRDDVLDIFESAGFNGTVIIPTNRNYDKACSIFSEDGAHKKQVRWERIAMHCASAILFWIPRSSDMPGFTTNVEFGEWYKKDGVFVGHPDLAEHVRYLDKKLSEQKKTSYSLLEQEINAAIEYVFKRDDGPYFTSDTHFSQERTLELSRRPFNDVFEMDLTLISNWNKKVNANGVVYHAGDFIDPDQIDKLEPLLDMLNFGELHWVLGNYDRKVRGAIENLALRYGRKIMIYDRTVPCKVSGPEHEFVIAHEPNDFEIKAGTDDIVLFGHIHGRDFAKRNGFDLASDYHGYSPIDIGKVEWFANAMKYWDNNVYSDTANVISPESDI